MINLSYSRISLSDIAQKLQLDSPEDAEFIVAKVSNYHIAWKAQFLGVLQMARLSNIIIFIIIITTIVSRGDWLGKPTNIKVENNGAVVYVGSSLTVHNPLFFILKL